MKLIFANNYYYLRGGSERVFFDEMEILREKGHQVVPFSRHFEKNYSTDYGIHFAPSFEYDNAPLFKKFPAAFKLIYSRECADSFCKLLNNFRPEIVHAHNIYGRLTSSIIDAAKKRRVPVVLTLHDYKLICPSYLMLSNGKPCEKCIGGKFYNCLIARCHKGSLTASAVYTFEAYLNALFRKHDWITYLICPSEFIQRRYAEAGIPEKKLVHIPYPIKTGNFEPNFTAGNYVLFAGRLSGEKGVLTLLKAVKSSDILVKIVGDGPMRIKYETFAKDNEINNVDFSGYKTGSKLKAIFRNAAFLVCPSEWYENLPMTIMEAFAYGKPVIGSNIGGVPEMITDEETGLLFRAGNHRELREKIQYLLSNPSLITRMGKAARKRVEEEYKAELHYQKLMEVYKKAIL